MLKALLWCRHPGGGGGGTPYDGLYGEAPPESLKGVPVAGFRYMKG